MTALLDWRVWLALGLAAALAFGSFTLYRAGKAVGITQVQTKWDADKLRQTQQLAAFNAENRRIEQRRQSIITEALNAAKKRETTNAAATAGLRAVNDGLRHDLADSRALLSSASSASLRKRVTALETVLEQCSRANEEVAGDAAGLASDLRLMLDAWPK